MVGWDLVSSSAIRNRTFADLAKLKDIVADEAVWKFGFNGEFHGHIILEVEAVEGTILDVSVDDWEREDGMIAIYRSNQFTDATDRFILQKGRQTVELFHARGGKFIQVTMR